jgi:threonine aldolase
MRIAISTAEVGDEQKGEDPTTIELQELVCELLGKESAVLLPSGTMCNEIAYAVHCRPGDEILLDETSHALHWEGGGPAALAGATVRPLSGHNGIFSAEQVEEAVRAPNRYAPRSRLISVEQTSNKGGGRVWSLDAVKSVTETARRHGLRTHLDGARLFNATVASGTSARDFAAPFDSAWIDLTKGLGAPVGAVLCGDAAFIDQAWRVKQRWGGAMRQSGMIAAAGLYALRNNIDRLAEDHQLALELAIELSGIEGIDLDTDDVETNIVLFNISHPRITAADLAAKTLQEHGVRLSVFGPNLLRAVTHMDVDAEGIALAAEAIRAVLSEA